MVKTLKNFSAQSPENARRAQEDIFGMENSLKAITGYQSGLLDKKLMAEKQQEENKLKQGVASDPKKKQEFGDPWADIAKAENTYKQIFLPLSYLERRQGLAGRSGRHCPHPGACRGGKAEAERRAPARVSRVGAAFGRAAAVLDRSHLQGPGDRHR